MCIRWLFSTLPHITCSTARGWLPRYSTRGKTIVHVEGSFFNHCPLVFGSRKASLSFEATPRRVITLHPLEFRERSCKAGLSKSNACGSDPPCTQRRNHLQPRRSKRLHLDWQTWTRIRNANELGLLSDKNKISFTGVHTRRAPNTHLRKHALHGNGSRMVQHRAHTAERARDSNRDYKVHT